MNFYKSAALTLDYLDKNQGSVKGSLAAAGIKSTAGEAKRILALVIETLKYKAVLTELITTVQVQSLERIDFPRKTPRGGPSSQSLLLVLLHDLLFSPRQRIEASDKWAPKPAVLRHQARLKAELVRIQIRQGKSRKEDLARSANGAEGDAVRYVRYNPNSGRKLQDLLDHLSSPSIGMKKLDKAQYPVPSSSYFLDPHLDDVLLAFAGNTTWWLKDEWYTDGGVILQDKASCMPAKVLMEGWEGGEGECIDATAAPGNKTSYISALMHNKGKLHAFERSPNRFKTLERMLTKAHCANVDAQRADFLESDPGSEEYGNVTRILLDPSCSGSGIVNRLDYLLEDDDEETDAKTERLEKLASFQLQMILHAFRFPSARRIVYSTCSIHAEEDERVVLSALGSKVGRERGWKLAPRSSVIPTWERRGRPEEMGGDETLAQGVIRCLPEDKTNGFFVACFVRDDPAGLSPQATTPAGKGSKGKKRAREEAETQAEAEAGDGAVQVPVESAETSGDAQLNEQEDGEAAGEEVLEPLSTVSLSTKEKTAAHIERNKRKKAAQKAKAKKQRVD